MADRRAIRQAPGGTLTMLPPDPGVSVSTEPRFQTRAIAPPQPAVDLQQRFAGDPDVEARGTFSEGITDPAEARFAAIQRGISPAETEQDKGIRRQYLISQASRHGVPQAELAKQMQVEGVTPPAPIPPLKTQDTGKSEVQSSKILAGGLVQLVRKDGTVEVVPSDQASQELVKQAETRDAELQGIRSGEREEAKSSAKLSLESFKKLGPIRKHISNLDEAIRLLDAGAETGPIAKRFPSFKAATVELKNVQDKLGLDVIANTTFGALSESELAFALDSALPTGLNAPELKDWITRKRDAQSKLADYINETVLFLGTPGNTIADFLQQKRQQSQGAKLPTGVTEEDITETMSANNMTREQVLQRLGGQ